MTLVWPGNMNRNDLSHKEQKFEPSLAVPLLFLLCLNVDMSGKGLLFSLGFRIKKTMEASQYYHTNINGIKK